jgi:hypothetical protein
MLYPLSAQATNINSSLSVLSRVFKALADQQRLSAHERAHVHGPYRDRKEWKGGPERWRRKGGG